MPPWQAIDDLPEMRVRSLHQIGASGRPGRGTELERRDEKRRDQGHSLTGRNLEMTRLWRDRCLSSICLAALACVGGCDGGDEPNAPPGLRGAGGPGGPGGPGGGPGNAGRSSEIRQIMVKLNNKGPNSLANLIDAGLKAEKPAWETIAPQAKEYAQLAADLGKHDPPKGSKESWSKLTAEYAGLAGELDKAAQAKDKAATTAAQGD